MERDKILNPQRLEEDVIFGLQAQKNNLRFTIEQTFRSLSKLVLSVISSELFFSS